MKVKDLIEQLSRFPPEMEVGLDMSAYSLKTPKIRKSSSFELRAARWEDFDSYNGVEVWLNAWVDD